MFQFQRLKGKTKNPNMVSRKMFLFCVQYLEAAMSLRVLLEVATSMRDRAYLLCAPALEHTKISPGGNEAFPSVKN